MIQLYTANQVIHMLLTKTLLHTYPSNNFFFYVIVIKKVS